MSIHPDNLVRVYKQVLAPRRIEQDIIWSYITNNGPAWIIEWITDVVADDLQGILDADDLHLIRTLRYAPNEVAHAFVFLAACEFPQVQEMLLSRRQNALEATAYFFRSRLPQIVEDYFRGQSVDTFAAKARVGYIQTVGF